MDACVSRTGRADACSCMIAEMDHQDPTYAVQKNVLRPQKRSLFDGATFPRWVVSTPWRTKQGLKC